jgi:hypothetical protein
VGKVDLSEFVTRSGPPPERRWQQVLAELAADDEAKLRAALLEPGITATAISTWLERRNIIADPRTIKGWRRLEYATMS